MTQFVRVVLPGVLASLAVMSLGCGKPKPVAVVLERAELEERVKARFPIVKEKYLSTVTLDDPRLVLREGSDRIGLDVRVRVKVPLLREYEGRVAATGKLDYRVEEKAFYLAEPVIEKVELPGLQPDHADRVRRPIEAVARSVLERFPVYELRSRNVKELTAQHVLRSVTVRDGRVHAELGLPF